MYQFMVRQILCLRCGEKSQLAKEDIANGWKLRKVEGNIQKPKELLMEITGTDGFYERTDFPVVHCDHCSVELPNGSKAVAITQWRSKESAPGFWESEYFKLGTG